MPPKTGQTANDRFWAKVDRSGPESPLVDGNCWLWTGALTKGYGQLTRNKTHTYAHIVAFNMLVGAVPQGLQLDHLCRRPTCVRPSHLEPVTRRDNLLRGTGFAAVHARKTHCKHGHPFDEANTGRGHRGGRYCRACARLHARRVRNAQRLETSK